MHVVWHNGHEADRASHAPQHQPSYSLKPIHMAHNRTTGKILQRLHGNKDFH